MRWLFPFIVLTIFVNACTTTRIVPVETVRVDSVFVAKIERDSIYQLDSVFVRTKADTVYLTKVQYRYHDRYVYDTINLLQLDTITKVIKVEKALSKIEQLKLDVGGGVLWALPIIIGLFILYCKIKK